MIYCRVGLCVWFGISLWGVVSTGQPVNSLPESLADVELTCVRFIDAERGIAVGDRGVILKTDDGGVTWKLPDSPTTSRLESVSFVDEKNGWIVGGSRRPYTHSSHAVILRTTDGGNRWILVPAPTLPALRRATFFDDRNGIALGDSSFYYGAGIFQTTDGGGTWQGITGDASTSWRGGFQLTPQYGLGIAQDGQIVLLARNEVFSIATNLDRQKPLAAYLNQPGKSWLVGTAGLVLNSESAGRHWTGVHSDGGTGTDRWHLPSQFNFDWQTVECKGKHVWIAGRPGTFVYRSRDGGQHWQRFETGQSAPIFSLNFVDSQRGWAVGSLGTILATRDGGETWTRQHGSSRLALLAVVRGADNIPLEVIADLAGAQGYRCGVELVDDSPDSGHQSSIRSQRIQQAVIAVGGSSVHVHSAFDLEALVGSIRLWCPDVILTHELPAGQFEASDELANLVLSAVEKAAEPSEFSNQLECTYLPIWQTRKVAVVQRSAAGAPYISPGKYQARLGRTLSEHTLAARGLVGRQYSEPAPVYLRIYSHDRSRSSDRQDLFTGVMPATSIETRRTVPISLGNGSGVDVVKTNQRQMNTRVLLERLLSSAESDHVMSQLETLTAGYSAQTAGDLLFSLAGRAELRGQTESAAEIYRYFIRQYPNHELNDAAIAALVFGYSSDELAWQKSRQELVRNPPGAAEASLVQQASATTGLPAELTATDVTVNRQRPAPIRQLPPAGGQSNPIVTDPRFEAGRGLGELIRRKNLALQLHPSVRFSLASMEKVHSGTEAANKSYRELIKSRLPEPWRQLARRELSLSRPAELSPSEYFVSTLAGRRPKLDGILTDECWEQACQFPVSVPHDEDAPESEAYITHDSKFLFLAIRCRKRTDMDYPVPISAKRHDEDLSGFDRVEWFLDTNRDYVSGYHMSVDARGQSFDACYGNFGWNPEWFVACQSTPSEWCIEAAIPIQELAPPDIAGRTWALTVYRHATQHSGSDTTQLWPLRSKFLTFER